MKTTKQQVEWSDFEAQCINLSVVELIQVIQQLDKGQGDYATDRQAWQKDYSVDMLLKAVAREH